MLAKQIQNTNDTELTEK